MRRADGSISELHERHGEGAGTVVAATKNRAFGNNPFATIFIICLIKVTTSSTFNVITIKIQNMGRKREKVFWVPFLL